MKSFTQLGTILNWLCSGLTTYVRGDKMELERYGSLKLSSSPPDTRVGIGFIVSQNGDNVVFKFELLTLTELWVTLIELCFLHIEFYNVLIATLHFDMIELSWTGSEYLQQQQTLKHIKMNWIPLHDAQVLTMVISSCFGIMAKIYSCIVSIFGLVLG